MYKSNRIVALSDFVLESNFASIEENDRSHPDHNQGLPNYEELFSESQEPPSYQEAVKDDIENGGNNAFQTQKTTSI